VPAVYSSSRFEVIRYGTRRELQFATSCATPVRQLARTPAQAQAPRRARTSAARSGRAFSQLLLRTCTQQLARLRWHAPPGRLRQRQDTQRESPHAACPLEAASVSLELTAGSPGSSHGSTCGSLARQRTIRGGRSRRTAAARELAAAAAVPVGALLRHVQRPTRQQLAQAARSTAARPQTARHPYSVQRVKCVARPLFDRYQNKLTMTRDGRRAERKRHYFPAAPPALPSSSPACRPPRCATPASERRQRSARPLQACSMLSHWPSSFVAEGRPALPRRRLPRRTRAAAAQTLMRRASRHLQGVPAAMAPRCDLVCQC
jgi:hypothetical protein